MVRLTSAQRETLDKIASGEKTFTQSPGDRRFRAVKKLIDLGLVTGEAEYSPPEGGYISRRRGHVLIYGRLQVTDQGRAMLEDILQPEEALLAEGILQDVTQSKLGKKVGSATVRRLSDADPSKRNKYLRWAVKRVSQRASVEDTIKAMNAFHQNAKRLKKKDINQYKMPKDVIDAVGALGATRGQKRKVIKGEADTVYQDDRFLVIHPKTTQASQKYGRGTRWCTAATDSQNYFCTYAGAQNIFLYYVIDSAPEKEKHRKIALALHPEAGGEGEYFDAEDMAMSLSRVKAILGASSKNIFAAVYRHMKKKKRTYASLNIEKARDPKTDDDFRGLLSLNMKDLDRPGDQEGDGLWLATRDALKKKNAPSFFMKGLVERGLREKGWYLTFVNSMARWIVMHQNTTPETIELMASSPNLWHNTIVRLRNTEQVDAFVDGFLKALPAPFDIGGTIASLLESKHMTSKVLLKLAKGAMAIDKNYGNNVLIIATGHPELVDDDVARFMSTQPGLAELGADFLKIREETSDLTRTPLSESPLLDLTMDQRAGLARAWDDWRNTPKWEKRGQAKWYASPVIKKILGLGPEDRIPRFLKRLKRKDLDEQIQEGADLGALKRSHQADPANKSAKAAYVRGLLRSGETLEAFRIDQTEQNLRAAISTFSAAGREFVVNADPGRSPRALIPGPPGKFYLTDKSFFHGNHDVFYRFNKPLSFSKLMDIVKKNGAGSFDFKTKVDVYIDQRDDRKRHVVVHAGENWPKEWGMELHKRNFPLVDLFTKKILPTPRFYEGIDEQIQEGVCDNRDNNNPWRTPEGPKKFAVCVDGKVVRFGDPNMEIKRDDPKRRKNFRARHNCDNPGPKSKARYWACKTWEKGKTVSDVVGEDDMLERTPLTTESRESRRVIRSMLKKVGLWSPAHKLGLSASNKLVTIAHAIPSVEVTRDAKNIMFRFRNKGAADMFMSYFKPGSLFASGRQKVFQDGDKVHVDYAFASMQEELSEDLERTPLKTEATTTANIATFMTPLAPPINRAPLKTRLQGYEHGETQKDLCKRCKKRGYICPECRPARKK